MIMANKMTKTTIEITAGSLAAVKLFYDLSLNDRKVVADKSRGVKFAAGDVITSHNDMDNDVYFIISSKVRIAIYSSSGKEVSFRDLPAGEMFGEIAAVDDKSRSAYVVTLYETTLAAMTAENFLWLMQLYPSVMTRSLEHFAQLIRLLSERVVEFSCLDGRTILCISYCNIYKFRF